VRAGQVVRQGDKREKTKTFFIISKYMSVCSFSAVENVRRYIDNPQVNELPTFYIPI